MHLVIGLLKDETLPDSVMRDGNTHVVSISKTVGVPKGGDNNIIRKGG
jgi:hypothetical protein